MPPPAADSHVSAEAAQQPPSKRRRTTTPEARVSLVQADHPPDAAPQSKSKDGNKHRRVSQRAVSSRSRRAGRKSAAAEAELGPGSWVATDGTMWRSLRPPSTPSASDAPEKPSYVEPPPRAEVKPPPPEKPRIWAFSKGELLAILPELSKALDPNGSGIFKEDMALEPPLIFLEGSVWPDDRWDPQGILELSIEREFSIPPGRGQNADGVSIDYNEGPDADMALIDDPEHSLDVTSDNGKESLRSGPAVCHPSELLRSKGVETAAPPYLSKTVIPYTYDLRVPCIPSFSITSPAYISNPRTGGQTTSLTGAFAMTGPRNLRPHSKSIKPPTILEGHPLFSKLGLEGDSNRFNLRPATFDRPPDVPSPTYLDIGSGEEDFMDFMDEFEANSGKATKATKILSARLTEVITKLLPMLSPSNQVRQEVEEAMPIIESLASEQATSKSHVTPWNREVRVPSELPPDLQRLQECQLYGIPVSVVMSRDSALLPFSLEENVGVVYLGFFKILESRIQESDRSLTARVRWRYKFKWIPGGDGVGSEQPPPNHPWWASAIASEDAVTETEPSPYSLIPLHLSSEYVKHVGHPGSVASEVIPRLGWHCGNCGRLNVQKQLCFQHCSTCEAGNGMTAVGVMMAPDSRPVDTYPDGVTCDISDIKEDEMRTFVYTLRKGVFVKHLFTCNRSLMQKSANQLFLDVQMQVPLTWHEAKTTLAAGEELLIHVTGELKMLTMCLLGPYFSYLAGSGHEQGASATPWSKVPECVTTMRGMMQSLAGDEHGLQDFQGNVLSATKKTFAMLCLGADVELSITPKGGFSGDVRQDNPSGVLSSSRANEDDFPPCDPEESEEEDIPLSISTARMRTQPVVSTPVVRASKSKSSKRRTNEMFVTLVHGDVLFLHGDDFEYSLRRTGMSILVSSRIKPHIRLGVKILMLHEPAASVFSETRRKLLSQFHLGETARAHG
ncbi:hypothetical protein BC835DRAFT_1307147 [Cytidiella melzeri]|nr:hypothetical protein BC835DRAFT_1307147 [Cytidiella melzeri]